MGYFANLAGVTPEFNQSWADAFWQAPVWKELASRRPELFQNPEANDPYSNLTETQKAQPISPYLGEGQDPDVLAAAETASESARAKTGIDLNYNTVIEHNSGDFLTRAFETVQKPIGNILRETGNAIGDTAQYWIPALGVVIAGAAGAAAMATYGGVEVAGGAALGEAGAGGFTAEELALAGNGVNFAGEGALGIGGAGSTAAAGAAGNAALLGGAAAGTTTSAEALNAALTGADAEAGASMAAGMSASDLAELGLAYDGAGNLVTLESLGIGAGAAGAGAVGASGGAGAAAGAGAAEGLVEGTGAGLGAGAAAGGLAGAAGGSILPYAIGTGALALGSIAGGLAGANATEKAADTAANAQNNATAVADKNYQQTRTDFMPFYNVGVNAIPDFEKMLRGEYDMKESPAAKYQLQQATKAMNRNLAARGLSGSGNAVQRLTELNQSVAANDWNNQYNRILDALKLGTGASASMGNAGQANVTANQAGAVNLGQIATNQGANQASLYSGISGALSNAAATGLNAYKTFNPAPEKQYRYDANSGSFTPVL
jgi:hypothetical protein